jgi:hypothetical protein
MDAGCYGNGEELEVARAKILHWIYLEVNVSTEDNGAFKVEVLFADTTQNGMEQGRRRHRDVNRAADAPGPTPGLASAVPDELFLLTMEQMCVQLATTRGDDTMYCRRILQ